MDSAGTARQDERLSAFSQKHRVGLLTVVFTDIVGSTQMKREWGEHEALQRVSQHHTLVRELLGQFAQAEEIETAGDSFLLVFAQPSAAVKFALQLAVRSKAAARVTGKPVFDRVGVHVGEVFVQEGEGGGRLFGSPVDLCARIMGLAQANQVLMTRFAFDNARRMLRAEELESVGMLSWLNHGLYALKGMEEPVEICEARIDAGPPTPPPSSDKAQRLGGQEELVLGWRPAVGQVIPATEWLLGDKLGEGGFGEVWLGQHRQLKERRVFKFCFRADRARSLKREMTLFRLLRDRVGEHPNIASLRDVYFEEPPYYLAMEFVAGKDLRGWCEAQGGLDRVPLAAKLEVVAQAAQGLQAAHQAGVIHRDVKPGNILVGGAWAVAADQPGPSPSSAPASDRSALIVKLTDFGVGQVLSEECLAGVTRAGFTQTLLGSRAGSHTGTQLYMAPELLAGQPACTRSDIYSLGVVLYQLLVGDFRRPVTADWTAEIADPLLRADLQRCLAGKPEERFAGAGQLAEHLRTLERRRRDAEERQRLERRAARRHRLAAIAATAAAVWLLVAAALGYGLRQAKQGQLAARRMAYAADMNLAWQAVAENDLGRAAQALDRHRPGPGQPDLRGWEWRCLWQQCQGDALRTLCYLPEAICSLAWLEDGRRLAIGARDGAFELWEPSANRRLAHSQVSLQPVPGLGSTLPTVLAPQAQMLAQATLRTGLRLYDPATRRELAQLSSQGQVSSLSFSANGNGLAAYDQSGKVWLWALPRTNAVAVFPVAKAVRSQGLVVVSSNATRLIVGEPGGQLRVLALPPGRLEDSRVVSSLQSQAQWRAHRGSVAALAWSPGETVLASCSVDLEAGESEPIVLWEAGTSRKLAELAGHKDQTVCLAFSPDGRSLASASNDQTIRLWEVATGRETALLRGHRHVAEALAFSSDGRLLASGAKDGSVCLWNAQPGPPRRPFVFLPGRLPGGCFTADGRRVLGLSLESGAVLRCDVATATVMGTLPALGTGNMGVACSPRGRLIVSTDSRGAIRVGDLVTAAPLTNFLAHAEWIATLDFSRDGQRLLSVDIAGNWKQWDTATWGLIDRGQYPLEGHLSWARSADNRWVATSFPNGKVWLFDVATKQRRMFHESKSASTLLLFSPDARLLVSGEVDAVMRVWSVPSMRQLTTFRGHRQAPVWATFSPQGDRLATVGMAIDMIRIWDVATWQEVAFLRGPQRTFAAVEFSPDGNTIASVTRQHELCLWRAPSWEQVEAAEDLERARFQSPDTRRLTPAR